MCLHDAAKVADAVPVPLEAEFAFGLELILEGLSYLSIEGAPADHVVAEANPG